MVIIFALLATAACVSSSVVKTSTNNAAFELLILHNNDMHARFEQTSQLSGTCTVADREAGKCYGGFPRVAYVVKEARKAAASGDGPPVLYLNAGDTYTGTAWFTIYKWKIAAEFINALQPDAVCLGNHEFDNGVVGLNPFIDNLMCPVLAANLILYKEPSLEMQKNLMSSVVFQMNEKKVGVIGYLTPETKVLAKSNNVEYIDEVVALREEVSGLRNNSVDIIIALGHSGYARDLEIARDVDGLDLVIGGHTNTFLWNGMAPDAEQVDGPYPATVIQPSGRTVLVVQAYAYTKYLGNIKLSFDDEGEIVSYDGKPVLLDNSVPHDTDVLDIVTKYQNEVGAISEAIVGSTLVMLDMNACRYKECNLGNLITDAMIYKYASVYRGKGWTDAPIAIIQRGGIRASIAPLQLPANVTRGDVINVLPFEGTMMEVYIYGTDILKMLEYSVKRYNPRRSPGEFLHMSGLKVTYDMRKRPGMRLTKVSVRCGMCITPEYFPLNKTMQYKVLMSSFLASGGDGYSLFKDLPMNELSYNELNATIDYISTHSPILPGVEDRITLLHINQLFNSATTNIPLLLPFLLAVITLRSFVLI